MASSNLARSTRNIRVLRVFSVGRWTDKLAFWYFRASISNRYFWLWLRYKLFLNGWNWMFRFFACLFSNGRISQFNPTLTVVLTLLEVSHVYMLAIDFRDEVFVDVLVISLRRKITTRFRAFEALAVFAWLELTIPYFLNLKVRWKVTLLWIYISLA